MQERANKQAQPPTPGLRQVLWCGFVGAVALTGWVFVHPTTSHSSAHSAQHQPARAATDGADDPSTAMPMPLI